MNNEQSLLSQHELYFEYSDDIQLRKLLGQGKRKLREVVRQSETTTFTAKNALRRLFRSKK